MHRLRGQHGRLPAGGRRKRQAFLPAELEGHDSPGARRRPRPGHRYRDPCARHPQDPRADEQDPGRAHRPAAREDRARHGARLLPDGAGIARLRPDRQGHRQARLSGCAPAAPTSELAAFFYSENAVFVPVFYGKRGFYLRYHCFSPLRGICPWPRKKAPPAKRRSIARSAARASMRSRS
ncbi:hypothetical protein VARIO8X_90314 [Burkholderiales bacterium 8X]|nr:hypothetical protein VARIO8X_90314 [Burkholderiales bacterium 8X]